MAFNEKTKHKNQKNLIEALYEITQSEKSEIKFKEINWDIEKPILKLKGLNETPDFTITFGIDENDPTRAHIIPDCDPDRDIYFDTTYTDIKEFSRDILTKVFLMMLTKDILTACSFVMLKLGINCYFANYEGDYGLLKHNPADKVLFLSAKVSLEIDIETITDAFLCDSVGVPDLTDAILIETDSGKSYFIALEQPDEFAMKLEERINKLRNIEPQLAS